MKKILVLTSTFPRWKGDTNPPFVFELSRRLTNKFNISVLTPHFPGSKDTETLDNLKVYRFHYFINKYEKLAGDGGILPTLKANMLYFITVPFFLFFEIIATIKLVKRLKPDIIHAHWIIPQGLAAYINFLINKTPYIVTSHGSDLHSLGMVFLKRIILRKAKEITVVSSYLKEEIKKIDPKLLSKTIIIPMGVDSKQFNPNKYDESIKRKCGITGKLLLFVGRLAPEKGVTYLIDAMPAVLKVFPTAKLVIIGGGILELKLKAQSKKLDIGRSVLFMGEIGHDDLPPYFATADILVAPSIREGFGLTIVEAFMSGCSVIGTNVGGIVEIVPKLNLIKPSNASQISKGIIKELKKRNTNSVIFSPFEWANVCDKYFDCLSR